MRTAPRHPQHKRRDPGRSALHICSLHLLALSLSACAVLTVDVDVYKGPLVNEREIRLDQLTAMVVGIHPVLVDLRATSQRTECEEELRKANLVLPGCEPQALDELERSDRGLSPYRNPGKLMPYASKVNAIIDLYSNQSDINNTSPGLVDAVDALNAAITQMLQVERVQREYPKRGRLFTSDKFRSLRETVCAKPRNSDSLPFWLRDSALDDLRAKWKQPPPQKLARERDDLCQQSEADAWMPTIEHVDTTTFEMLELTDPDRLCAGEPGSQPSHHLICATRTASAAYWTAWQAMMEQLLVSSSAGRPNYAAIRSLSASASLLISANKLWFLGPYIDSDKQPELRKLWANIFCCVDSGKLISIDQYDRYRFQIAAALQADTSGTLTRQLLDFSICAQSLTGDGLGFLDTPIPDLTGPETVSSKTTAEVSAEAGSLSASVYSLGQGRPRLGLFRQIELYQQVGVRTQSDARSPDDLSVKHDLSVQLLEFAQKLLSLADGDAFFDDNHAHRAPGNFAIVLQAVGNSILTNIDDLARQEHFRDTDARIKAPQYLNAVRSTQAIPGEISSEEFIAALGKAEISKKDTEELTELGRSVGTNASAIHGKLGFLLAQEKSTSDTSSASATMLSNIQTCLAEPAFSTAMEKIKGAVTPPVFASNVNTYLTKDCKSPLAPDFQKAMPDWSPTAGLPASATSTAMAQTLSKNLATDIPKRRADAESAAKKVAQLASLDYLVPSVSSTVSFLPPQMNDHPKSVNEIWDALEASLEYLHVTNTIRYGDAAQATVRVKEAQQLVSRYRALHVPLRSPLAFLRNSYPATGLQSTSAGSLKGNLLVPDWIKHPDFSGRLEDGQERLQAVDKQFWQNINRVKVAGSGNLNYAVAKDDIGNWYVKGYSTNKSEIFKSMSSLARFSLGAALPGAAQQKTQSAGSKASGAPSGQSTGAAGPDSSSKATTDVGDGTGSQEKQPSSPADQLYAQQATDILKSLQEDSAKFSATLLAAVVNVNPSADKIKGVFGDADDFKTSHSDLFGAKDAASIDAAPDRHQATVKLLQAMHEYAVARIDALAPLEDVDQLKKDQAAILSAESKLRERSLRRIEDLIEEQGYALQVLAAKP